MPEEEQFEQQYNHNQLLFDKEIAMFEDDYFFLDDCDLYSDYYFDQWYGLHQDYDYDDLKDYSFSNVQKDQQFIIDNIKKQITILKPYLNFISISYITQQKDQYLKINTIKELGIKVFDTQQMINKSLKVEYLEDHKKIDIHGCQSLIDKPELETIRQIQNISDILLDDIFIINLQCNQKFVIYEIEQIDLPLEIFHNDGNYRYQKILQEFRNKFYYNLSQRFGDQANSPQFYYVKITDESDIQIKSFLNVIQCVECHDIYLKQPFQTYQQHYSFEKQTERIFWRVLNQQHSLRRQLKQIQKKVKIQKQNLLIDLEILASKLFQYHSNKLFQIIQQHPKYHLFSLIDFNQHYIVFKAYHAHQKYFLKLQKFTSSHDANTKKIQYESLKQFQKENQGIFFEIGEHEVMCAESGWYVSFEENLTLKQNNHKLIPFKQFEKIQKCFQQLNCSQNYIYQYLII